MGRLLSVSSQVSLELGACGMDVFHRERKRKYLLYSTTTLSSSLARAPKSYRHDTALICVECQ